MNAQVKRLSALLRQHRVHHTVDDSSSASIGKRYSRQDQVGTPFGITVDFESIQRNTYTLRERDSMAQVRATETEIVAAIISMINGDEDWESVTRRLPKFEGQEVNKADPAGEH